MDDPNTYDLTAFAREFTWAILFWNTAESKARWMLSGLLGGSEATLALASDLGIRALGDAMSSTARAMENAELRSHVEHFTRGFIILNEHRNLYVHGLAAVDVFEGNTPTAKRLEGRIMTLRGHGRLRATNEPLPTSRLVEFKRHCLALTSYGEAIMRELDLSEDDFGNLLGLPEPSLAKPTWPARPDRKFEFIQE